MTHFYNSFVLNLVYLVERLYKYATHCENGEVFVWKPNGLLSVAIFLVVRIVRFLFEINSSRLENLKFTANQAELVVRKLPELVLEEECRRDVHELVLKQCRLLIDHSFIHIFGVFLLILLM